MRRYAAHVPTAVPVQTKARRGSQPPRAHVQTKGRRGRPPLPPRTALARWLQARDQTVVDFAAELAVHAKRLGLPEAAAPTSKALRESINAAHWPHPITIWLVSIATAGNVDVKHWVRDLEHLWPRAE